MENDYIVKKRIYKEKHIVMLLKKLDDDNFNYVYEFVFRLYLKRCDKK